MDIGLEPGQAWVLGSNGATISKKSISSNALSGVYVAAIVNIKGLGYKKMSQNGASGYTYAYGPEVSTTKIDLTNKTGNIPSGAEFIIIGRTAPSSSATINFSKS